MAERPVYPERTTYAPRARQERWIVPILDRAIREALDAHAPRSQGASVLDTGCGGQPFRAELEGRGMRYHSLDAVAAPGITPDFIAALDGEIPEACRAAGPYELILCTEVLEHVADWPAAFENLTSLLAPGGVLMVTSPFVYPLHEEPHDFWRPTTHAIRHWAGRAGLEVVELRQLGDAFDVLGTIVGAYKPEAAVSGPMAWMLARLLRLQRDKLTRMCLSAFVRRRVRLRSSLYLSNLAVLRRTARAAERGA